MDVLPSLPLDNQVLFAEGRAARLDAKQAADFSDALRGGETEVILRGLYPRVWRLLGNGGPVANYTSDEQTDCALALNGADTAVPWWGLRCGAASDATDGGGGSGSEAWRAPCESDGGGPEVVLVSAEVATGVLASFSQLVGGLTGMYVVYVLAVGSFARSFTTNLVTQIPYAELPSTHRLTALCEDIYAMRHAREFALEEPAHWLLIRIYRSPAVLFEFTRTKSGDALPERPNPRAARAPRARGTETDFADEEGGPRRSCDRDAGEGGGSNEGGGGENDSIPSRRDSPRAIFDDVDSFVGILASYYARREGASFVMGVHTDAQHPAPRVRRIALASIPRQRRMRRRRRPRDRFRRRARWVRSLPCTWTPRCGRAWRTPCLISCTACTRRPGRRRRCWGCRGAPGRPPGSA